MLRVSAIDLAAARETLTGDTRPGVAATARADRRVSASNQTWLGTIVDGRYRVLEAIGRGGMGVVYKVEHVRMGKIAAMKVLHRDLADDPDVIQRFEREAAAVSRLQHPNAVQVFDFGAAQGALYLIMEYVRGQDLATIVERDGPLPFARAAPLLTQILGALGEAHELGIVHRDLKPDNVLVTRTTGGRDFAGVLDFGWQAGPRRAPTSAISRRSSARRTMAPERIRGDEVDARTDVYAMGALMYRLSPGSTCSPRDRGRRVTKHRPPRSSRRRRGRRPWASSEVDALVLRARWPRIRRRAGRRPRRWRRRSTTPTRRWSAIARRWPPSALSRARAAAGDGPTPRTTSRCRSCGCAAPTSTATSARCAAAAGWRWAPRWPSSAAWAPAPRGGYTGAPRRRCAPSASPTTIARTPTGSPPRPRSPACWGAAARRPSPTSICSGCPGAAPAR
jgi:serine/threonine protein kinase